MSDNLVIYLTILGCALVTYTPRFFGFYLGKKIDSSNKIFIWMEHVAYAIVFAITIRLILLPTNALKEVDLFWRIIVVIGISVAYIFTKRFLFLFVFLAVLLIFLEQIYPL